jgi:hypothetical protein
MPLLHINIPTPFLDILVKAFRLDMYSVGIAFSIQGYILYRLSSYGKAHKARESVFCTARGVRPSAGAGYENVIFTNYVLQRELNRRC